MARTDRALREDFIKHMSLGTRWPSTTAFINWINARGDGFRNGEYGKMRKGTPVSTRLVVRFVEFLAERAAQGGETEGVHAALEFLQTIGINDFGQHSASVIAKHLLAPEDEDFLGSGVHGLLAVFLRRPDCEHFVNACLDEGEVKEAIRWLYVSVGRQINEHKRPLTCNEAIDAAEDHMRIPIHDYQQCAIEWWRFDPWTVMLARGDRVSKTGMSIVLPMREEAHAVLKAGAKWSYDLTPSDLQRPSRILLLEGAAQRPVDLGGEEGNTSSHTYLAMICQVAILSHCSDQRRNTPRRALAFAGTPRSRKNLEKVGFHTTGTTMSGSDILLFERVMNRGPTDTVLDFFFNGFGDQAYRWLTPPRNLGPRKRGSST